MKRINNSSFLPPGKKKQAQETHNIGGGETVRSLEAFNKSYEDKLRQLKIVESNAKKVFRFLSRYMKILIRYFKGFSWRIGKAN